jgi:hypothetical protein
MTGNTRFLVILMEAERQRGNLHRTHNDDDQPDGNVENDLRDVTVIGWINAVVNTSAEGEPNFESRW